MERAKIIHGDCLHVMKEMEAESVDAIVTDPPYGLGFMCKDWDKSTPAKPVFERCLRVAKPGTYLLAFGGTRTFHRLACAIEDAGWEIRDTVMWVYGSGFPKSHNLGNGWGTALKPAWEPIIVARKPLVGTIAKNVEMYGTGAMNIDGCRVGTESTVRTRGDNIGATGWSSTHRSTVGGSESGRWPANLIHDGSEEVVELFPETGVSAGGRSGHTAAYQGGYKREFYGDTKPGFGDSGSASRFFYCAKASKSDRDDGCENLKEKILAYSNGAQAAVSDGASKYTGGSQNIGINNIKLRRNNHPTVKPTNLMRYLCRLVTPINGLILDPFAGSGSTGKAALLEGFRFIGIERESEYVEIAKKRCSIEQEKQLSLA